MKRQRYKRKKILLEGKKIRNTNTVRKVIRQHESHGNTGDVGFLSRMKLSGHCIF